MEARRKINIQPRVIAEIPKAQMGQMHALRMDGGGFAGENFSPAVPRSAAVSKTSRSTSNSSAASGVFQQATYARLLRLRTAALRPRSDGFAGEDFWFFPEVSVWCASAGISRPPVFSLATTVAYPLYKMAPTREMCLPPVYSNPDPILRGPTEAGGAPGRIKVIYGEAPASVRRVSGETPVSLPGSQSRFGLYD
jgi:hypothetical protein